MQQILALQNQTGKWDKDRDVDVLHLMYYNPNTGNTTWNKLVPPVIKNWCEHHVFPWIGHPTKLVALIIPPGADAKMHVDCAIEDIGSQQHRFRLMLQGKTSDVYFKTAQGRVDVPEIAGPYIMEVGYPHSMKNTHSQASITLAFGAPWYGKDHYDLDQINVLLSRQDYGLPDDAIQYAII